MLFQPTRSTATTVSSARTHAGQTRAARLAYWIPTVIVALNWTFGGFRAIAHAASAMEVFHRLGYPAYFAALLGTAQLCGVVAILAPVPRTLREWAYAGLTFDVCAAIVSLVAIGAPPAHLLIPVIALGLVLASHRAWQVRLRATGHSDRHAAPPSLATV